MIRRVVPAAMAIAAIVAVVAVPSAHKTVVSKFTYYQDVRPILQAKCGSCHVDGGIARTLMTYDGATNFPWSIQQQLLSRRMPPFAADQGLAPIKGHQSLSAIEFDTLMTWAAGGVPEGARVPLAAAATREWPLGPPDLILTPSVDTVLAAGDSELDREIVWPVPGRSQHSIRAVDLLPGAPAIVRRATIAIKDARGDESVVGLWVPGDAPQPLEANAAFELPADTSLVLRVSYRRPPGQDGAISDRSRVGVYFAGAGARPVRSVIAGDDAPNVTPRTIMLPIERAAQLVSVRPISGPADARVRLVVVDRSGTRTPIMRLTLRPEWPRRYVLQAPIALPSGSRLEVSITPAQPLLWESLLGAPPERAADTAPVRIALEIVS